MVYDWPYWEAVADEVLAAATACSADAEDSGGPSEAADEHSICYAALAREQYGNETAHPGETGG